MTSSRLNGLAPDLVLHRVPRGQEDDGDAGAAAPQPPDDVEPVHVGQHDVEHDEIRPVAARRLHRLRAGRGGDHLKSGIAQAGGQQLEDVRLILHNEQPGIMPLPPVG
jgi:hypothetical protein